MAFDLTTPSPEMKRSPEVIQTPELQEAQVEVPQVEQAPAPEYAPAEPRPVQQIEVPHQVEQPSYVQHDDLLTEIESTLADKKIMDIYATLAPDVKRRFKEEGEKLARMIRDMMSGG